MRHFLGAYRIDDESKVGFILGAVNRGIGGQPPSRRIDARRNCRSSMAISWRVKSSQPQVASQMFVFCNSNLAKLLKSMAVQMTGEHDG